MRGMYRGMLPVLLYLLLALCLGGCGQEKILEEVVETVSLETEKPQIQKPDIPEKTETQDNSEEEITSLLWDTEFHFAYDTLNEYEQIWYTEIAESLGSMKEKIELSQEGLNASMDEEDIDRIFQCVLIDHPEIFYVDGYTYTKYTRGDQLVSIEFTGTFSMDWEKASARRKEIEKAVKPLLDQGLKITGDYEKIKFVYETIIYGTDYDLNAVDNQNIYSVFVNGASVCQGYAKAMQFLLNRLGIECVLVQGSVENGEGHAWNLVKADGSYYYVDATWGDASYQPETEGELDSFHVPDINYDYLCITTEQLLMTHTIESMIPLPACIAVQDNYYVHEGALFTEYDKEQMRELFRSSFEKGKEEVTFKCADRVCYEEIKASLIDSQDVFDYLTSASDSVAYTHNDKQLSMTFWVTNE